MYVRFTDPCLDVLDADPVLVSDESSRDAEALGRKFDTGQRPERRKTRSRRVELEIRVEPPRRLAQDTVERDRVVSDTDLDVFERAREARPQHATRDTERILGETIDVDQRPGGGQVRPRGDDRQIDASELG